MENTIRISEAVVSAEYAHTIENTRRVAMSKNKENVPKLRFPGFTDAWEQRRLGGTGQFH